MKLEVSGDYINQDDLDRKVYERSEELKLENPGVFKSDFMKLKRPK